MSKYSYPAVFSPEENGGYSLRFPDLEGCYTCGENITEALMMGQDVLAFTLYDYEREGCKIPPVSPPSAIFLKEGEFINYIACDTIEYRKRQNKRTVKKTLTIPEWLNEAAIERNLNFSQELQEALIAKIESL